MKAGEVHAEDVRDAVPVADRRELANGGEAEGLFLTAGENRLDVLCCVPRLSQRVLRRRRLRPAGVGIGHGGAIAHRPEAYETRHLQKLVDHYLAPSRTCTAAALSLG